MKEKTKLTLIIISAVFAFIIGLYVYGQTKVNKVINFEEKIQTTLNDISIEEKNRNDKLLTMADVISSYDSHEAQVLRDIANGRKSEEGDITAGMVITNVVEAYPELKANENYNTIMKEISLSSNTVADRRETYNSTIESYNRYVRSFPNKQILSLFGYEKIEYERLQYLGNEDIPKLFNNE